MKKLLFILLLINFNTSKLWCAPFHKPNLIDQIQTTSDVDIFLKRNIHLQFDFACKKPDFKVLWQLKELYNYFYDSLNIVPFLKYDFDKDGRTDLLINGGWHSRTTAIVIMDKGNKIFETHPFLVSPRSLNIPFIKFDTSGKVAILNYFLVNVDNMLQRIAYKKLKEEYKTGYLKKINCVYKFDAFIEKNPNPVSFCLNMIELEKGGIFRDYKHYTMRIFKNRKAVLAVGTGNKNLSGPQQYGTYSSKLNKKQFQTLKSLADYINLINLKNKYDAGNTDPAYGILKVKYNKANSIKILDRSMSGSFGLMALYQFFDKLYEQLNWTKAKVKNISVQWDTLP